MKPFDVDAMLSEAKKRTGLSNFGEPDFLGNLQLLISSINDGAAISPSRWDIVFEYIVRILINRLWFEEDVKNNPDILQEELLPPVAIVSLPRTGSTKTQRLLGVSGHFQNLLWWHMHMLSRIPGKADGGVEERLKATREFEEWAHRTSPTLEKGHPRYAEAPEEEMILQEYMFAPSMSVQFSGSDYTPEDVATVNAQPIYDYMKKQLQYIQWQHYRNKNNGNGKDVNGKIGNAKNSSGIKPWLLKAPQNMGFESELVNSFGRKMKMIVPHRDPLYIVCSITKLAESWRLLFSEVKDKERIQRTAKGMLAGFSYVVQQHMAWRDANPDIDILDISFHDINNNTSTVLEKVYNFLDVPLTAEVERRVDAWAKEQAASYKKHSYSLEEFGLTKDEIYTAYAPYLERFSEFIHLEK